MCAKGRDDSDLRVDDSCKLRAVRKSGENILVLTDYQLNQKQVKKKFNLDFQRI